MLRFAERLLSQGKNGFKSLNQKSQYHYGKIDKYLDRLPYPIYYYVIAANVGIYGLWQIRGMEMFMLKHFTHNPVNMREGRLHTLITYAFSHQSFLHLAFNMVSLYFFGRVIEGNFGSKRFLGIYLAGALAGSLLGNRHGLVILGASASTNAMLTYFICNFPREIIILFVFPLPAWIVGLIILYSSYSSQGDNSNISHESHLAGILTGVGYYFLTRGK